jgi:predicted lipoprotein with Yx(FWY)xxD motif
MVLLALVVAGAIAGAAGVTAGAQSTMTSTAVNLKSTKLGKILVDNKGRTLYLFEKDTKNKSNCSGACAVAWPPLVTTGSAKAGSGVNQKLLGTTKRSKGTQVTYNGHPLYRFTGDHNTAGQTNGEGLNAFGAHWYVLNASGNKIDKS